MQFFFESKSDPMQSADRRFKSQFLAAFELW